MICAAGPAFCLFIFYNFGDLEISNGHDMQKIIMIKCSFSLRFCGHDSVFCQHLKHTKLWSSEHDIKKNSFNLAVLRLCAQNTKLQPQNANRCKEKANLSTESANCSHNIQNCLQKC